MGTDEGKRINIAEYNIVWDMFNTLVINGMVTKEEMDYTMARIVKENDLHDISPVLPTQRIAESSERSITILPATSKMNIHSPLASSAPKPKCIPAFTPKDASVLDSRERPMLKYISLTELVRSYQMNNPSYVIQSWLRSENTLAFLDLWERENNSAYDAGAYATLLEKKKTTSFTVTAKQWIEQTKAIGITSKQGRQGGTFAHPLIARQFATWLSPKYMMRLLRMAQREDALLRSFSKQGKLISQ